MAISDRRLRQLRQLIEAGQARRFYDWPEWERTRRLVLELDHHECVKCRARGRYARAVLVHHVRHLQERPELALSVWLECPDGAARGERQLVSLCKRCHEEEHPVALAVPPTQRTPVTAERWD